MKRIWFQFTRKTQDENETAAQIQAQDHAKLDTKAEKQAALNDQSRSSGRGWPRTRDSEPSAPDHFEPASAPASIPAADSEAVPASLNKVASPKSAEPAAQGNGVFLRLSGTLWIHPLAEYRKIAITADREIPYGSTTSLPQILPAGLHLDVGEMRWIGGSATAVHEESRAELSPELPFSATAVVRLAYLAINVGELIFQPPGDNDPRHHRTEQSYAWGNGLLRYTQVYGTCFDERFHFEQLELERLQLIQGQQAWIGQLAQPLGAAYEGPAGRALVQQARTAPSMADPLAIVRRFAQRYARSLQIK